MSIQMSIQKILSFLMMVLLLGSFAMPSLAQEGDAPRAETGGATTLEDILARQRGETVDDQFRRDAVGDQNSGAGIAAPLGTLGGAADPELWRDFRYGTADIISTDPSPAGNVVIQDGGMRWLEWRSGPLRVWGGYMLLGMMGLLLLFYLIRGKIMIEGKKTGEKILRFKLIERIAHWTMAIPFMFLAITGLSLLFGRVALIPIFGQEIYTPIALVGKLVHHFVAWPFMVGLALSFVLWVWKNFPAKVDFIWILKAGGLFTKGVHPSAGKFNAGEKIVFWMVIILGFIVSLTGLALIFPFQINIFEPVFGFLNSIGLGNFNTNLAPQEEMQFAQIVHAGIAFVYMTIIIAHIYLGSVGMEGAIDAMTKGEVEVQWAKEHHDLWYEEVIAKQAGDPPAK